MSVLNKNLYEQAEKLSDEYHLMNNAFVDRCHEVFNIILKVYDITGKMSLNPDRYNEVYYDDYEVFYWEEFRDYVTIYSRISSVYKMKRLPCILSEGTLYLCEKFPTRFLFEDCEEEIKNGKLAYVEKYQKINEKKQQQKKALQQDQRSLKEATKEKLKFLLSEDEIKALGIKL